MEKIKFNNISLLVQGQIFDKSKLSFIDYIEYYKSIFSEIILSTYTEEIDDSIKNFCKEHDIILVHQSKNTGNIENRYNIAYQTMSTLLGLKHCTKPFTIKHRTDEKYSNLEALIEVFFQDTEKWVSGGTFFGAKSYYLYHAADHLFIGRTNKLLETFSLTMSELIENIFVRNNIGEPAAEITFTKNFIRINNENPVENNHDTLMKKYFNFVSDKHFEPFLIRFNSANKVYNKFSDFHPCFEQFQSIDDILTKQGMVI